MLRFGLIASLLLLTSATAAYAQLYAAVLPSARSVQVGQTATAFGTIINAGSELARGCSITLTTNVPATFLYQTTDPHTNQVTGTPNTPGDIPAGGAQTFVVALTPTAPFTNAVVRFNFACADMSPASVIDGVNTLSVFARSGPVPDIIAIVATLTNDGIVNIPGVSGTGVFAVAAVNIGAGEASSCPQGSCTCTPYVGVHSSVLSIPAVQLCETEPATGACLSAPLQIQSGYFGLYRSLAANEIATFSVFVQSPTPVPFDPATNRISISFLDFSNCFFQYLYGSTSVAVRTQ